MLTDVYIIFVFVRIGMEVCVFPFSIKRIGIICLFARALFKYTTSKLISIPTYEGHYKYYILWLFIRNMYWYATELMNKKSKKKMYKFLSKSQYLNIVRFYRNSDEKSGGSSSKHYCRVIKWLYAYIYTYYIYLPAVIFVYKVFIGWFFFFLLLFINSLILYFNTFPKRFRIVSPCARKSAQSTRSATEKLFRCGRKKNYSTNVLRRYRGLWWFFGQAILF